MAKGKVKKGALAPILPEFKLGGDIDKDDITAIAVVAHEGQYMAEEKALREMKSVIRKKIVKTSDEISKEKEAIANRHAKDAKLKAVCDSLKKGGFGNFAVEAGITGFKTHQNTGKVTMQISLQIVQEEGRKGSRYHHDSLSLIKNIPETKRHKELVQKLVDLNSEQTENDNEIIEVQKKLSNIDKLEREARAALAAVALNSTKEGRAVLESMGVSIMPQLTTKKK